MFKQRKSKDTSEEDYYLSQGMRAGFSIFLGAERRKALSGKVDD